MMRSKILLAVLHLLLPLLLLGVPALAQQRGMQLLLEPPQTPLTEGETGSLTVTLVDPSGASRAAEQDLVIDLATGPGLLSAQRVVLSSGKKQATVALKPERPGAWVIQATARGVFGTNALVVCIEAPDPTATNMEATNMEAMVVAESLPQRETATQPRTDERPGTAGLDARGMTRNPKSIRRPEAVLQPEEMERHLVQVTGLRSALAARVLEQNQSVQPPEALKPRGDDQGATGDPMAEGRLVLKPELSEVRLGPDGQYRSSLFAIWFKGEAPSPRRQSLELELLFDPDASIRLAGENFPSLAPGEVKSSTEIISDCSEETCPDEVQVVALYDQMITKPVRVRFLPPKATALAFSRSLYELRGLASAQLDVVVQLLDKDGLSLIARKDYKTSLSLEGEGGVETHEFTIAKGEFQSTAKLRVSHFGSHTLRALSAGLEPAISTVNLRLDYMLLVVALFGGMVGSVARLLFTRQGKKWKRGLVRALALGVVAAALALLLALFQVLKAIEDVLAPGLGGALSNLPFQNPLAVFLIGLIAGLGLETLLGFFTGWKAKKAAGS